MRATRHERERAAVGLTHEATTTMAIDERVQRTTRNPGPGPEPPPAGARRAAMTAAVCARDLACLAGRRIWRRDRRVARDPIGAGIAWLERTHDATGRRGSSKGYSLLRGWLPAYPETTGYVLETLLGQADRTGDAGLARRAVEMADWELEIQEPDGGIMQGHVGTVPRRSIVFNTGMVLHGWVTLLSRGHETYAEPARRAAQFLTLHMRADGTWDPGVEYARIPHTYNAFVAWAMLRYAGLTGDPEVGDAACRHLDWVVDHQRPNGWFEHCVFKAGTDPSTHSIGYTLRGLLESEALLGEGRWLAAVERTSEALVATFDELGTLPGAFDSAWRPAASYNCLTGSAQLGGTWLRLHAMGGDVRFRTAGLRAIELAARHQERLPFPEIAGALAGAFPVWGRYAPMQYPNWATRFLVESLMLREQALGG